MSPRPTRSRASQASFGAPTVRSPAALRMARSTAPDFIDRAGHRPAPVRPMALSLVLSLRPSQWTKNLVLFAALIFGQRLLDAHAVGRAIAAFVIFCALSGVVYLINDVADREAD